MALNEDAKSLADLVLADASSSDAEKASANAIIADVAAGKDPQPSDVQTVIDAPVNSAPAGPAQPVADAPVPAPADPSVPVPAPVDAPAQAPVTAPAAPVDASAVAPAAKSQHQVELELILDSLLKEQADLAETIQHVQDDIVAEKALASKSA